jgi:predicted TIM-barrel fold metal-dependent hydrolase
MQNIPIFDSLTHITHDGGWFNTSHTASIQRLLSYANNGFKKALLVGIPGEDQNIILNESQKHPELFLPIAALSSENVMSRTIESELSEIAEKGFKGIKIHPRALRINLESEKIIETINAADQFGLVSLICTVHKPPSPPLVGPVYNAIHKICNDKSVSAKVILLHGGYYDLLATSEIIRCYDNVLLDLSATISRFSATSIRQDIKFLFNTLDQKLCIGSDFPESTIDNIKQELHQLGLFQLKYEKVENILWNNLNKLFNYE